MRVRAVLAVDVGGSHVKVRVPQDEEQRGFDSGDALGPQQMVEGVLRSAEGWRWDVVSIGIPSPIRGGRVIAEPVNLGPGWVGFDFDGAFGKPTRVVNDAVMQAIGSYEGGRMLFLGLGTGLGSALVVGGVVEPLELGHLPFKEKTFEDYMSARALERHGKDEWQRHVADAVAQLAGAIEPDYVVIGGGGADQLDELPPNCRRGDNDNAFVGGFRLWDPDWEPRTAVGDPLA